MLPRRVVEQGFMHGSGISKAESSIKAFSKVSEQTSNSA